MILIVDDNKKYIARVIELLKAAGSDIQVITANDYNGAVELLAKEKPSIVMSDVNMPGKSGIELLHYIKREGWDCKVIMVSNHSNPSYRKLCLEAGADHFLDKSKEFGQIPSVIAAIIEQ